MVQSTLLQRKRVVPENRFSFLNFSLSVIHWRARVKKDRCFSETKLTGNHEVVGSACLPRFLFDCIVLSCRVVQHDKNLFHRSSGKKVGLCSKWLQQSERCEARGRQVGIKPQLMNETVKIYIQTFNLLCKTY